MNTTHQDFISNFCIAGINYRKSDVIVRGKFSLTTDQCEQLLQEAVKKYIPGAFVLSTCNRTEIYGISSSPQELIERITAAADYADCIVIVNDQSQANLRWANSTLTTNGVITERSVTVIAFVAIDGGMASGVVTRSDVAKGEIDSIAKAAGDAARAAGKAADAAELARDFSVGSWGEAHTPTGPDVFAKIAPDLGDMFQRSRSDEIELFGYAVHTHRTTWVGSKGGLRLRWDPPAGRM